MDNIIKRAFLAALISSNFAWVMPAHAAESTESLLDYIVVTATRTEMDVKEAPSSVEVIDQKRLEQIQAKTLREALKTAIGVTVFNDFQGRSNVSIRGSESRHVLILVDGKRLGGELSYNSANAWEVDRIRMEDVERVEIIRGPAGAMYGSDAIGGVINIITKKPDSNSGSVNYEYNFYENGKSAGYKGSFYLQGVDENVTYKLSAGINKNRPYLDPEGSGDELNFFGKNAPIAVSIGYELPNGNQLSADFSRIQENNQKGDSSVTRMTPMVWSEKKSVTINDNTRTDYGLSYSGGDTNQKWSFRAYQSIYDKEYTTKFSSVTHMGAMVRPGTPVHKIDTVKRTLSVIEGQNSWHSGDEHYLTAGFEWRKDDSEGTRLRKKGTLLPTGKAESAYDQAAINYSALYLQDEFRPDGKWLVIPSVRFDWSDKFSSETTAQLAATYSPAADVRVKAVVGQGYKTPTVNELYHYWEMYTQNGGGPGQFFEGNPDLEPEKSTSYELAVEKDWDDRTTAHIGFFRNNVRDLINSYWTGKYTTDDHAAYPGLGKDQVMTYRNVPKAVLQGIEVCGTHKLTDCVSLNLGYTYLDAQDKTEDMRLRDRARHQVVFGVSYEPENSYAGIVAWILYLISIISIMTRAIVRWVILYIQLRISRLPIS